MRWPLPLQLSMRWHLQLLRMRWLLQRLKQLHLQWITQLLLLRVVLNSLPRQPRALQLWHTKVKHPLLPHLLLPLLLQVQLNVKLLPARPRRIFSF